MPVTRTANTSSAPHRGESKMQAEADATQPRVGLTQTPRPATSGSKARTAGASAPKRIGDVWKQVTIIKGELTQTPQMHCNHCRKVFCGGVTRIKQHIMEHCNATTEAFLDFKQKMLNTSDDAPERKRQKAVESELDNMEFDAALPSSSSRSSKPIKYGQQQLKASFNTGSAASIDNTIADFYYGCNIPPTIAGHPLFKRLVEALKVAPASYKPPPPARLLDDLLTSSTKRLRAEEEPMRKAFMKSGGTFVSDGWDDIQSNHLVNLLYGTSRGMFFEGTIKLSSTDSENAEAVAKNLSNAIKSIGELNVVQVVTDTCSVMKSAWKLLEAEFPWITCTCCAPHVLSLYLKDIGKIAEVSAVLVQVSKILNRFWGRTRWPRARLREVTAKNHGAELGLYRAKVLLCVYTLARSRHTYRV